MLISIYRYLAPFYFRLMCLKYSRWIKTDAFEADSLLQPITSDSAFITSVLVVNAPQLFISFWYIVYNSLLTRLEMSWEWDLYSVQYRPLRVTQPK